MPMMGLGCGLPSVGGNPLPPPRRHAGPCMLTCSLPPPFTTGSLCPPSICPPACFGGGGGDGGGGCGGRRGGVGGGETRSLL